MMTKQEIYDKVCAHLAQQKHQATVLEDDTTRCRFRTPSGDKCAVGCLIPDSMYESRMEQGGACTLFDKYPNVAALIGVDNRGFCSRLQSCHDDYESPSELREALKEAAALHGVTPGAEQAITQWS